MSNLKDYKILVKDTISFLENSDTTFIDSNSDFFKKDMQNARKKSNPHTPNLIEKKKYNVGFIKQIPPSQNPSLSSKEVQKTQAINQKKPDRAPPQKEALKPSTKETSQIKDDKTFVLPKKPGPVKPPLDTKKIILDNKPKVFDDSFSDIKKDIAQIFPSMSLAKPLDDKIAKQKSQKYKLKNIAANITILAYRENEKFYKFLDKLSVALDIYFYPSKVVSAYLIEKENNWDIFLSQKEMFLIISADYTIFELPNLRKHYKEKPSLNEKYLNDIPLFLLPDISLYFKEPTLKSSLFQALKLKIQNIKNDK